MRVPGDGERAARRDANDDTRRGGEDGHVVSVCGCDAAGARRGADEVAGEAWETGKVIYFFSWASQADDFCLACSRGTGSWAGR